MHHDSEDKELPGDRAALGSLRTPAERGSGMYEGLVQEQVRGVQRSEELWGRRGPGWEQGQDSTGCSEDFCKRVK